MSTHDSKSHAIKTMHSPQPIALNALIIVVHLFPQLDHLVGHALVAHTAVITRPIAYLILVATAEAA